MITCPHCGQEFSEFCTEKARAAFGSADSGEQVPANGNSAIAWSPPRPHVKTNNVRLALLAYPNLTHRRIGQMFGISRRRVWGIAERYGIATRHRSDRENDPAVRQTICSASSSEIGRK